MHDASLENAWVAVQVKVNREKSVAAILRRAGYEAFLPLYRARGARSPIRHPRPLFPGYLFCRYDSRINFRIIQTPGVIRLVGEARTPMPIAEDEIAAIERVVQSGIYSEPWRLAEAGAHVRVCRGPLSGLEGTLIAVKSFWRLIVSVTLLQRSIAVDIAGDDVEIISREPRTWHSASTTVGVA
jgi:transcription termination/antitermination protein NusG